MLSSKEIVSEARPIIERQLDDAELIAGLRDVVSANGGDWSALKALVKAQIQDERDDAGDGKRVRKILEKAEYSTGYADMLGWANMNEQNFSAETGEITDEELDRKAPADGDQSPAGGEKELTPEITEPQPNAAQSAQASGPETSTLDGGRADETPVDDSEPNATPAERAKGPWGSGSGVTAGETATKFTPLSKDETPLERCLRNKPNCQHPEACRSSVFNEHCRACRGVMASLETEGSAA